MAMSAAQRSWGQAAAVGSGAAVADGADAGPAGPQRRLQQEVQGAPTTPLALQRLMLVSLFLDMFAWMPA